MPARNPWPLLIVVLVAGFLSLTAWSFYRAARDASTVTDRDYYNHGLRFEQTRLEQQAAASQGWDAEASLDGRWLRLRLKDRQQRPVSAVRAELTLSGSDRSEILRLPLTEESPGIYRALFPATLHGEQTARIDCEREGARLGKQLVLSLP